MSLTLPPISTTLSVISATLPVISATIFSPSDESFSNFSLSSGQPSLSLLQFHISSRFYSSADLQSLQFGTQIPTLLRNRSLTASVFGDESSVNGVKLDPSPVFNDGFLAIYRIERFLNPNFRLTFTGTTTSPASKHRLLCACGSGSARSYGAVEDTRQWRSFFNKAGVESNQRLRFSNGG